MLPHPVNINSIVVGSVVCRQQVARTAREHTYYTAILAYIARQNDAHTSQPDISLILSSGAQLQPWLYRCT